MPFSLKFFLFDHIFRYPMLCKIWYGTQKRYQQLIVSDAKELVLEGYPRCANSFAVVAFERVQQKPVAIAHHLHSESQLIMGSEFGLPILVLIRDPADAATSLVTRHPEIGIGQALRRYLKFYQTVEHLSSYLLVADFRQIVTNYASVIYQVNKRFRTNFNLYHNSPEEDAKIFADLDRINLIDSMGDEKMVARPTKKKTQLLNTRRGEVLTHPLFAQAKTLYARIISCCEMSDITKHSRKSTPFI